MMRQNSREHVLEQSGLTPGRQEADRAEGGGNREQEKWAGYRYILERHVPGVPLLPASSQLLITY